MLRWNSPAIELGASPEIVSGWIDETQAKRAAAGARLRQRPTGRRPMTREEITNLARALGDPMTGDQIRMMVVRQRMGILPLAGRPRLWARSSHGDDP